MPGHTHTQTYLKSLLIDDKVEALWHAVHLLFGLRSVPTEANEDAYPAIAQKGGQWVDRKDASRKAALI